MLSTYKQKQRVVHICIYLAITVIYLLLASCSKKQADEIAPEPPPQEKVTYNNFVQALFQSRCSGCHAAGGPGSGAFTFSGYASVVANAERIRQAVIVTKRMPPNGSLSAAELESLSKWFEDGMPQQ